MHLHILGICGTLMGSIALLARQLGYRVTGCDENVYPPMSTQLENAGISLSHPYSRENIPTGADLILIGNAGLPRGNPAVEEVLDRNVPYMSGAEWLGRYILQDRWVIAVAGTHGKTTTSSMIAWILESAGLDPGFLIGGVPRNFGESARTGSDPFFVIEADEYDTSYFDRRSKFLHYRPRTLVLNNLEFDHADIFPDLAAIQNQFHLLLRTVPGQALIITPEHDANLQSVIDRGCWTPVTRFNATDGPSRASITALSDRKSSTSFEVMVEGRSAGTVHWDLTGQHNRHNALAAITASRHAGVRPEAAVEALCDFRSVKRRMEVIYDRDGVRLYDDFAHHPTAISTTLEGLHRLDPDIPLLAIIEPASHTMRRGVHRESLASSVLAASRVIWYEPKKLEWDLPNAVSSPSSRICSSTGDIIREALGFVQDFPHCHIVIMSNGGFDNIHQRLIDALESSSGEPGNTGSS